MPALALSRAFTQPSTRHTAIAFSHTPDHTLSADSNALHGYSGLDSQELLQVYQALSSFRQSPHSSHSPIFPAQPSPDHASAPDRGVDPSLCPCSSVALYASGPLTSRYDASLVGCGSKAVLLLASCLAEQRMKRSGESITLSTR